VLEKLVSFSLKVEPTGWASPVGKGKSRSGYASSSVLKEGTWLKVSVHSDGVFRLDRSFFRNAGLDLCYNRPQKHQGLWYRRQNVACS